MDKEYEVILVKNFFNETIQDRLIYELCSEKKRINALSRLCHNYDELFIQKYTVNITKTYSDYTEIINLLKSYGAKNDCYAISWNQAIDGQYLPLKAALENTAGLGMPSIISCLPDKLLYFESEREYGSPARFILKKD